MEDGGCSLFDFVKKCHRCIQERVLSISHWKQVVKVIFKQMIEAIQYIHSKNTCHFDVSLENFIINDVEIQLISNGKSSNFRFLLDDIRVKLIDFGILICSISCYPYN